MKIKLFGILFNFSSIDMWLGLLLGLPISFPQPYYWFSFIAFGLAMFRINKSAVYKRQKVIFVLIFISGLISSLISVYNYKIDAFSTVYSSTFFVFFLFGAGVKNILEFAKGYVLSALMLSLMVVFLFFKLKPYTSGILMFVYEDARMWAFNYVPDWPNFYCFGVCLAAIFSYYFLKHKLLTIFFSFVAVITTSRIALVMIAVLLIFEAIGWVKQKKYYRIVLLVIAFVVVGLVSGKLSSLEGSSQLTSRLGKTEDRQHIYGLLIEQFTNNPVFGIGNVLTADFISDTTSAGSYHNTYLEILTRYGTVGFVLFLLLIFPSRLIFKKFDSIDLILLFMCVCALFQNILGHPHYAMTFSAIMYYLIHRKKVSKTNVQHFTKVPGNAQISLN